MNLRIDKEKVSVLMAKNIMTVKDLAEKTGIKPCYFPQLFKHDKVKPATVGKIAAALGVNVEEIIVKGE